MTISEMIHEIPHMRYRLESTKHKETLDEIEEVLRHHKEIIEVLDKIRTEIEQAIWEDVVVTLDGTDETRIPRLDPDEVLEIIDKYRRESEV